MRAAADAEGAPPALALSGIEKRFGAVRALAGVSFDCRPGEIHALVGENGAGKSTLMRVLAGVHQPDHGEIAVRGVAVRLSGPSSAQRLGIAMVNQDTRLVPDLDVAQNIFLGREPGAALLVDRPAMERASRLLLERLGVRIALRARVSDLTLGQRQLVEIARALTTDPSVLILDEPTSALDGAETARLMAILRDLRDGGAGVIFISHRLPEVLALADRITVLKDGEVVGTVAAADADEERLVSLMVGRAVSVAYPSRASRFGPALLEIAGLASPGRFAGIDLSVAAGEIVGLGGIQGNGQAELARAMFGLLPVAGEVRIGGRRVRLTSPRRAIDAGLVYVPGDRRRDGLFLPHAIRPNVAMPHLPRWASWGVVSQRLEAYAAQRVIADFAVRTPSDAQPVGLLSGGNQQKVVLGRWTLGQPRVFVLEEPTQGIDVATKLEIYRRVRDLAKAGAAVLLVSSDLLELIGLCDRIAVFAQGRIVDIAPGPEATEERIVGSAVGARQQHAIRAVRQQAVQPLRRRYASAALLAALIVVIAALTGSRAQFFLTWRNLGGVAMQVSPLALVALGQLATILIGGIDLSVGPLISLVTAIGSFVLVGNSALSNLGGVLICLAAGLAVGGLNVLLILRLRIPDLIATLASYSVVTGLALTVRPSPGGMIDAGFLDVMTAQLGPAPIAAIAVLAIYLAAEILLLRGRAGAWLYAVGSSTEAAYVVGIPIRLVRAAAYMFCSLCAVLAGLLVAARIGSGDPQAGADFTLSSITAVAVGGASVFGGSGTALGTLAGAVLVGVMQNALNYLHVSTYLQYVWTGTLTLIAVAAYSFRGVAARQ